VQVQGQPGVGAGRLGATTESGRPGSVRGKPLAPACLRTSPGQAGPCSYVLDGALSELSPSTDLCSPFDARTSRCNNRTTPGAGPSKAAQKPKNNSKHPWSRQKRGGAGHPTSVAQIGVGGLCV
jgi:hypothetical protein